MARLPTPGGDEGDWGTVLNNFLEQAHDTSTGLIKTGSVAKSQLVSSVQTSLDAADNAIPSSQKGAASGVATLDGSTKLTAAQLPSNVATKSSSSGDTGKAIDAYTGVIAEAEMGITSVTSPAYGATGDGTTNDSAAIQAAVNAANTAGGGVVYFPPGVYRIGTRIELKSGVSLVGAGQEYTTLKAMSGLTTSVIVGLSGTAAANLAIRGLKVDADYSATAINLNGIQITNGSNIVIDDCAVTNVANAGIVLTTCTSCVVSGSRVSHTGKAQAGVGFGVLLTGGTNCKVHDNHFTACNGMNIGGNTNALNASIVGNICDHTGTPRTTVSGAGQNPASSGTLTVVSTTGFPPEGTLSVAGIVGAITYTGLTATTFTGCAGASGTATDGGVARNGYESIGITDGCEQWLIKGNRSIDSGDNGISASANRSVVEGNIIDSPQFHGIALAGGSNSQVIGNWIRNPGSAASNSYSGIRVTDQANSIIALNRIFDDRGGSAMMRSGIRELNNSTNATYVSNRTNEFTSASVTYVIYNNSGGSLGTVTWDPVFKLAGTWTSPTNGESKAITFVYEGTSWIESTGTGGGNGNATLETAVATFIRTSVAAGVNSNLACNALYSTSNVTRWPLPRAARVVGVSISPVSALSGGTLTAKITKNGSVQASLNTIISNGETTKTLDLGYVLVF